MIWELRRYSPSMACFRVTNRVLSAVAERGATQAENWERPVARALTRKCRHGGKNRLNYAAWNASCLIGVWFPGSSERAKRSPHHHCVMPDRPVCESEQTELHRRSTLTGPLSRSSGFGSPTRLLRSGPRLRGGGPVVQRPPWSPADDGGQHEQWPLAWPARGIRTES